MQSLVLGATGIVGGYIVAQLIQAGQRPLALSRSLRQGNDADWIQGDLTNPAVLKLRAVEVLFCTVDIELLADAIPYLDVTSLKRVVAFTSTSIVTKIESEIPAERELLRRLADGERRLIAACEQRGIEWTILRPTLIYAEGRDGNISRLARLILKFSFLPLMGRAKGLRQPVHAEDLAIGAIQAAGSQQAINKTYALPGGETLTYREMIGRIFDALGKSRRIIAFPPWLWEAAFALAKPFLLNANAAMGRRMAKDMTFDPSSAIGDFGWNPRSFRPKFDEFEWPCRNERP